MFLNRFTLSTVYCLLSTVVLYCLLSTAVFAADKTTFIDKNAALGIKGTTVTAEFLNKTANQVPTGENLDGSTPPLYGLDLGATNTFVVHLVQGKQRATGTNTSTGTNKLNDSLATFQTNTVTIGDVVLNVTDKTSATVTAINSQTQLTLSADIFTATSKSYAVGPNIQQLPQAYVAGQTITFKAANANTGSSTVNVNNLGAKTIKKNGSSNLAAGDIKAGQIVTVSYDGTNMQIQSPQANTLWDGAADRSASSTPTANTIPVSGIGGKLDRGFIPDNSPGLMSAETMTSSASSPLTMSVGSVTAGDFILIDTGYRLLANSSCSYYTSLSPSGTSTMQFGDSTQTGLAATLYARGPVVTQGNLTDSTNTIINQLYLAQVTGSGTLFLSFSLTQVAATCTVAKMEIHAIFLKKQ